LTKRTNVLGPKRKFSINYEVRQKLNFFLRRQKCKIKSYYTNNFTLHFISNCLTIISSTEKNKKTFLSIKGIFCCLNIFSALYVLESNLFGTEVNFKSFLQRFAFSLKLRSWKTRSPFTNSDCLWQITSGWNVWLFKDQS